MIAAIDRIYRRVLMMVTRGRVTTGNDSGAVQMLQIKLNADHVRDNTPRLAEYGFTSMPPNGSDVVLVFIAGDRSNGVIVATGHQASRMKNLQPGEVAIFDNQGQSIYLTQAGIVINGAGLPITVNNTSKMTINAATEIDLHTPILKVSGDIIDNSGSNTNSMAQMRAIYNAHNHVVAGVQAGSSNITSNAVTNTE